MSAELSCPPDVVGAVSDPPWYDGCGSTDALVRPSPAVPTVALCVYCKSVWLLPAPPRPSLVVEALARDGADY